MFRPQDIVQEGYNTTSTDNEGTCDYNVVPPS